jgi:ComF family protein
MNLLRSYFDDFVGLFFPELCAACAKNLFKNEDVICTSCIYHFPYTHHHKDPDNLVARQLWGRFEFSAAGSFAYFRKGNKVQHLMHQLKYAGRPEAGQRMGELYGAELKRSEIWQIPDAIIPVPLHPAKQRKRGYNQSESIAVGLAGALNIPVITNNLYRSENTETQTRKNRYDRYENLKDAFRVRNPADLEDKHILLVDDVITTGATIEACALVLLELKDVRISIATLAFAD